MFTQFLYNKKIKLGAFALSIVVCLVFLVQMYGKAYREHGYDFTSYLLSTKALLQGTNPYATGSPYTFIYPLFLPAVLIPLVLIPYWSANLIWFFLGIGSMLTAIACLIEAQRSSVTYSWISFKEKSFVPLILVLFLFLNVIQNNVLNGQVNFIVICLCCAFLFFYLHQKNVMAAVMLASAIALKLTPFIFIFFLVVERKFMIIIQTLIFFVIMVILLPFCFVGNQIVPWYSNYIQSVLLHAVNNSPPERAPELFFSIPGFIQYVHPGMFDGGWVASLSTMFVLGACMFVHRTYLLGDRSQTVRNFLLYLVSILLITPMSETHHLAMLLVPCAVLVYDVVQGILPDDKLWRWSASTFIVMYLLGTRYEELPFLFFAVLVVYFFLIKATVRPIFKNS